MIRNIVPASLLFSLLSFTPAQAKWELYKFAEVHATATDNLQLFDGNELVYSFKPSVELSYSGNRFDTDIIAGVEAYHFSERGDDIVDPRLEVLVNGTLLDNWVYLSSSVDFGKLLPGEDFLDLNENSDSQLRFKFNPFLSQQFGRFADLYVGYGHQSLDNEADGTLDFRQDSLAFNLGGNAKYGGFFWGVGASYDRDQVIGADEYENISGFVSFGSTFGQSMYWELVGGQEINDFTQRVSTDDKDSIFWTARVNWTPSDRTQLTVGYGDRFFGAGPTFSFSHQIRNSTLVASYTRDVSNSDVTLDGVSTLAGEVNLPLPTLDIDLVDGNATDGLLFVDKRLRLGYKLAGRRSDLVIDAIYSDQDQLNGQAARESAVGRIAFDRHFSPLTTFRVQYEHYINSGVDDITDNENRIGVKMLFNFDRKERIPLTGG